MLAARPRHGARILIVRLGAMGDIIHALPAVASLKHSHPGSHLTWLVEPQWTELLEGNPFVDRVAVLHRGSLAGLRTTWRDLRSTRFDFAVDFQGLVKSALAASAARPERIFGFHQSQTREAMAALFYSNKTRSDAVHVVDRNLDLAAAAGAANPVHSFHLPPGRAEANLPSGEFVLACPLAGWRSKQWPLESYRELARRLERDFGVPLVVNGPPSAAAALAAIPEGLPHLSGIAGLIHATRAAAAVVGVDSGPLHIAAALGKPGAAIFGPTDPARNGPFGGSLTVLRRAGTATTYKRGTEIDISMQAITADEVLEALRRSLQRRHSTGSFA